jgi:hypothetical protein
LRREFETYGTIERVRIVRDKKGRNRGYAFIVYERERDMKGLLILLVKEIIFTEVFKLLIRSPTVCKLWVSVFSLMWSGVELSEVGSHDDWEAALGVVLKRLNLLLHLLDPRQEEGECVVVLVEGAGHLVIEEGIEVAAVLVVVVEGSVEIGQALVIEVEAGAGAGAGSVVGLVVEMVGSEADFESIGMTIMAASG